eukprot:PhM_4_TR12702/c0_g1_i1/m.93942/K10455/KLHL18; kelch-like protein 18
MPPPPPPQSGTRPPAAGARTGVTAASRFGAGPSSPPRPGSTTSTTTIGKRPPVSTVPKKGAAAATTSPAAAAAEKPPEEAPKKEPTIARTVEPLPKRQPKVPVQRSEAVAAAVASGEWEERVNLKGRVFYVERRTLHTVWDLDDELKRRASDPSFNSAAVSSTIGAVERAVASGLWMPIGRAGPDGREAYMNVVTRRVTVDLARDLVGIDSDNINSHQDRNSSAVVELTFEEREFFNAQAAMLRGTPESIVLFGRSSENKNSCEACVVTENGCLPFAAIPRECDVPGAGCAAVALPAGGFAASCGVSDIKAYQSPIFAWTDHSSSSMAIATHFPAARRHYSITCVHGCLVVTGGCDAHGTTSARTYMLDTMQQEACWVETTSMWSPRSSHATLGLDFLVQTNESMSWMLFAIGGFDGMQRLASVEKYSIRRNAWEAVAPMREARTAHCAVALPSALYVLGGRIGYTFSNAVERFDLRRQVWLPCAGMLRGRSSHSACVVGATRVLVAGGWDGRQWHSDVEFYCSILDRWTPIATVSVPKGMQGTTFGMCVVMMDVPAYMKQKAMEEEERLKAVALASLEKKEEDPPSSPPASPPPPPPSGEE